MNKKKIGEKTDSLLETEMIKEAKMIEESLLGNAANDFEISDEELDEAYQQFLKKMKAEGKLCGKPAHQVAGRHSGRRQRDPEGIFCYG